MFATYTTAKAHQVLNQIFDQGALMLYDKYLTTKLPSHTTNINQHLLKDVISNEISAAERNSEICKDNQPLKIHHDNYAIKCSQYHNKLKTSRNISRKINKHNSPKKQPRILTSRTTNLLPHKENPIALQKQKQPTHTELLQMIQEQKLRVAKQQQTAAKQAQIKRVQERKKQQQYQRQLLENDFNQLSQNNLKYTFDFEGKIINCTALNQHKNIHSRYLHSDVRVSLGNKLNSTQQSVTQSHRTEDSFCDVQSKIFQNISKLAKQPSKLVKNIGSDKERNDLFNNKNKRQISNLNLIELAEGTKLIEGENKDSVYSSRRQSLNKHQYTEKMAERKFQSFLTKRESQNSENNLENIFDNMDFLEEIRKRQSVSGTTHLPSGKSARNQADYILNRMKPNSVRTASERKNRSEYLRPHTTEKMVVNRNMVQLLLQ